MAAHNSDLYLKKAVDSIINQSLGFEKNIQIIIVNDGSTDNTEEICLKYRVKYPQNIKYISTKSSFGPAHARNQGLKEVQGKYVNFLDSDDFITPNTFKDVYHFFEGHYNEIDMVSIPIYYFGAKKGNHPLNFKFKRTRVVDLIKQPDFIQLSAPSSFFKAEAIKNIKFNVKLQTAEDAFFVNQVLLDKLKLGLVKKGAYYYRKYEAKNSLLDYSSNTKHFYTTRLEYFHFKLIECSKNRYDKVLKFIQYTLMYDLQWLFKIKKVDFVLSYDEIKELYINLIFILQNIGDDVIYNQKNIQNQLKTHIFFLKYLGNDYLANCDYKYRKQVYDDIIDKLSLNQVFIDIFEIKNDVIYISGFITTFFNKKGKVFAFVNDKIFETKKLEYPQRDRFSLNFEYAFNNDFEIYIPITSKNIKIQFKTEANDFKDLEIKFSRPCRLSNTSKYLLSKNHIAKVKGSTITVKPKNWIRVLKNEISTIYTMLRETNQGWRTGVIFRIVYFIVYPFFSSKRIWIFMDLPYLADDNGINLFKYAVGVDDDIEKVFVLNKDNFAFDDISQIGKTIEYGSIKHRIYTLFAEKVISSHPDNGLVYPFWGIYPFLSGLVKFKLVFLQHGITKDNISRWLNKSDKNISLIVTASKLELESFFKYHYNYHRDVPQLLGFPRYDALEKKEDYREIVIMPSWRRYFHHSTKEKILKSNYFKIYNTLINDHSLIDFCKKHGYKLIFKPHPNVYRFIELFETNDYVTIDSTSNSYNDIFTHASLIITDYSSIAFDFAYLKKPVIYYHYAKDYHFDLEESYFDYKTMGFGEVVDNHEELIDLIMEYVENECEMKDQYIKRVDDFFEFNDKNNCKRVYDAIKKMDYD
ncbi:MAG: CDP-glycerol glycerophosphotransferase family protein [Methanobrevibacter smithii]|nr:CDP-glycerol glycerophosphotransferase family protein [Methanobrevibacter smithii]MDO5831157.1 CDP-glycerol glycerophosphotransferase family protein [Methanobrevibacter smithii]